MYRELSKLIEGSTVGELAMDSSNIVELVKENYDVSALLNSDIKRSFSVPHMLTDATNAHHKNQETESEEPYK